MKKLLLSAFCWIFMIGAVNAANITLYYAPTCPFCHHAKDFINNELLIEMPDITFEKIDVSDKSNHDKFRETLIKCNFQSGGVPVVVINGRCFQGYAPLMNDDLRAAAKAEPIIAEKKTNNRPIFFYGLLIALIAGFGFFVFWKKK